MAASAGQPFSDQEVLAILEKMEPGAFAGANRRLQAGRGTGWSGCVRPWRACQVKWVHFVQEVDSEQRSRSILHYVATARMMAEAIGSVLPEDFGDVSIRAALEERMPAPNSVPFPDAAAPEWKDFKVLPVHRGLAFRVQSQANKVIARTGAHAVPGGGRRPLPCRLVLPGTRPLPARILRTCRRL